MDLDFFMMRQIEPGELRDVVEALRKLRFGVEERTLGPRTMLVLSSRGREVGHVDFAYYPYDPVGRHTQWHEFFVALARGLVARGP
ncbi:MAG: hypothetical protein AMXMBFR56_38200 [Polyangiaceae bacterium]